MSHAKTAEIALNGQTKPDHRDTEVVPKAKRRQFSVAYKKRFEAQQMITGLNALAHNLLTWFQRDAAQRWPAIAQLGLLRLIRDVLHLSGKIFLTMTCPSRQLA